MSVADRGELVAFLGVSDLDAARAFYGDVLGLELRDERPFALVADVGGTMLRMRYEGVDQDDRGIWIAPGGARIAWFLDPDRNNLALESTSEH